MTFMARSRPARNKPALYIALLACLLASAPALAKDSDRNQPVDIRSQSFTGSQDEGKILNTTTQSVNASVSSSYTLFNGFANTGNSNTGVANSGNLDTGAFNSGNSSNGFFVTAGLRWTL